MIKLSYCRAVGFLVFGFLAALTACVEPEFPIIEQGEDDSVPEPEASFFLSPDGKGDGPSLWSDSDTEPVTLRGYFGRALVESDSTEQDQMVAVLESEEYQQPHAYVIHGIPTPVFSYTPDGSLVEIDGRVRLGHENTSQKHDGTLVSFEDIRVLSTPPLKAEHSIITTIVNARDFQTSDEASVAEVSKAVEDAVKHYRDASFQKIVIDADRDDDGRPDVHVVDVDLGVAGRCRTWTLAMLAERQLRNRIGLEEFGDYSMQMYILPDADFMDCGYTGVSPLGGAAEIVTGGKVLVLSTAFRLTIKHEMGHRLGLRHAGAESFQSTYGDPHSVMGRAQTGLNIVSVDELDVVDNRIQTLDDLHDQEVTLNIPRSSNVYDRDLPIAMRIPLRELGIRGYGEFLYVSYRMSLPSDPGWSEDRSLDRGRNTIHIEGVYLYEGRPNRPIVLGISNAPTSSFYSRISKINFRVPYRQSLRVIWRARDLEAGTYTVELDFAPFKD